MGESLVCGARRVDEVLEEAHAEVSQRLVPGSRCWTLSGQPGCLLTNGQMSLSDMMCVCYYIQFESKPDAQIFDLHRDKNILCLHCVGLPET